MARKSEKHLKHSSQMAVALFEGDIEKARHEHQRIEKHIYGVSPKKGREERFQQMRHEVMEPFTDGVKSMEKLK